MKLLFLSTTVRIAFSQQNEGKHIGFRGIEAKELSWIQHTDEY
jgi:hypothetical protein